MMRKLLAGFLSLAIFAFCHLAQAGPVNTAIISETQLDDDPTSVTSITVNLQDYEAVAFYVVYDETEVGNVISASMSLDISYDGTNWIDASFYDYTGALTAQTSETLSSDGWYYCWLNPDIGAPMPLYMRMVIAATNTDSDDLAVVTAYLSGWR